MICKSCGDRRHQECPGSSWCDCQSPAHPAILNNRERTNLAVYGNPDALAGILEAALGPDPSVHPTTD